MELAAAAAASEVLLYSAAICAAGEAARRAHPPPATDAWHAAVVAGGEVVSCVRAALPREALAAAPAAPAWNAAMTAVAWATAFVSAALKRGAQAAADGAPCTCAACSLLPLPPRAAPPRMLRAKVAEFDALLGRTLRSDASRARVKAAVLDTAPPEPAAKPRLKAAVEEAGARCRLLAAVVTLHEAALAGAAAAAVPALDVAAVTHTPPPAAPLTHATDLWVDAKHAASPAPAPRDGQPTASWHEEGGELVVSVSVMEPARVPLQLAGLEVGCAGGATWAASAGVLLTPTRRRVTFRACPLPTPPPVHVRLLFRPPPR